MGYNPVTRMMYLADRTHNGIDVIATRNHVVIGLIKMPASSPPKVPAVGPIGVPVAINRRQLIVTDGGQQTVYLWDSRAPQAQPDACPFPTALGTDTDGATYDPVDQTVYIVTDKIGINLAYKAVVSQTPLPVNSDLVAHNSTDGKVYIAAAEDADPSPPNTNANARVYSFDPGSGSPGVVNLGTKVGPPCPGHGIDIDPISNVAVVGCAFETVNGDIAVDRHSGKLLNTLHDIGGTDAVVFNPNKRRFYAAAGLNSATTSGGPQGVKGPFGQLTPIVGVMSQSGANLVPSVAWTGGGHIVGVDPITDFVPMPGSQYPADPNSSTTGINGVPVFRDNTPPAQAPVTQASATLTVMAGAEGMAAGTVQFNLTGRRMHLTAGPSGLPTSAQATWISVPTTVTNELLACAVNPGNQTAIRGGDLLGDPLIGSQITLSIDSGSGGVPVGRGPVTLIK